MITRYRRHIIVVMFDDQQGRYGYETLCEQNKTSVGFGDGYHTDTAAFMDAKEEVNQRIKKQQEEAQEEKDV